MKKKVLSLIICLSLMLSIAGLLAPEHINAAESEVSQDFVKDALAGRTVTLNINYQEQSFKIDKDEITKLTIKSGKFSADNTALTVKAVAYIDRKVATVKTTATIKFKVKNDEWTVKSVKFKGTSIYKIPMKGTWKGTYVANQGETSVKFKITKVAKDGTSTGKMIFGSTPDNKVPDGSYAIIGGYDKETGKVYFYGMEWIEQPDSSWYMIDFDCYPDLANEVLTGNYSLSVTK